MSIPAFGPWDASIHDDPEQLKRFLKAQNADVSPDSIDPEGQSCVIRGSGKTPYQVTLSSYSCSDFSKRRLPCKHIYRLAAELKLVDLPLKYGSSKGARLANRFTLEESIAAVEALSFPAQRQLLDFLSVNHGGAEEALPPIEDSDVSAELKTCPLLVSNPTPISYPLSFLKKTELLSLYNAFSDTPPKKGSAKSTLVKWIVENVDPSLLSLPSFTTFSFISNFSLCKRDTYTYLLRKYSDDEIFEDRGLALIPHGSSWRPDGLYYFPDDKITDLLTHYGCNRCLNGFFPTFE